MELCFVTIFPELFEKPLECGILGIAARKKAAEYHVVDLRDFAEDRYGTVDDYPYGGGPGMVMMAPPIVRAVESVRPAEEGGGSPVILLSPGGRIFDQERARELAGVRKIVFICGRYKGVDERVTDILGAEPVSIGDFVLSGGELPALVIADAVVRHLPGVLGDERSRETDSFSEERGASLDAAYYTRPPEFRGLRVPDVLLSGNHGEIEKWRDESARARTRSRRPDLWNGREKE
ncbi:MAG TPA: tRNA (guanosine(37)-N1)-methyltransferase TrmD [Candidatus Eisenbacteria bacterium]|uniref:tRNA (guanine-N(1)-)-methyltransferase n=1 Tax=Eiseniibacteriota bacterium TaxID=2212470 RepID=A0A7V2F425_UNCEI|nr:tRNA (guanosine(37)-N1)-methyltransferase TrmD [Candidatus Eisenbacteria bacterium]